jgi:hypothetical protein
MTARYTLAPAQSNPWAGEVIDLESLHASATDAIIAAVHDLRELGARRDRESPRPVPFVVLGTAGVGKTHLFARLRRKLGPRAVFVLVRPLVGTAITPRFLLGQILEQLGFESYGLRQIDALAGAILAVARGDSPQYPRTCLDLLGSQPDPERARVLEAALEGLIEQGPDLDEAYVRRLLGVPFMPALGRAATLAWLGGREVDETQALRIGVREALSDEGVTRALRTLAVVAALAAPLVLVFDQLENLVEPEGHRVRAYGNLIADLVDVVRDVVIVQMALDTEWAYGIEPALALSQRQRVSGRRLLLGMPTPGDCEQLLKLWISRMAEPEGPYPWPFAQAELDRILSAGGTTPRMLLLDLRHALDGELPGPEASRATPAGPVDAALGQQRDEEEALRGKLASQWEEHLVSARGHVDHMAGLGQGPEPALLIDGLVALANVVDDFAISSKGPGLLRLATQGREKHLGLVCETHHRSIAAACRRLASLEGHVLGLRERWRDFKPTWTATRQQWLGLLSRPGAHWHWLEREDAVRLLALGALIKDARSGDISGPDARSVDPERVKQWIVLDLQPTDWPVTEALRSERPESEPEAEDEPARQAVPAPARGAVIEALRRLRVASLERLQREITRTDRTVTRAAVVGELRAAGHEVVWFGESLVSSNDRAEQAEQSHGD